MQSHPFSQHDLEGAKALIKGRKVGQVLFSEGTYQVEVGDLKKKEKFWPFLQMDDGGHVIDSFCTCPQAEKDQTCAHLSAAYLQIFHGHSAPLHVRFRDSLWNHLAAISSRRLGYEPSELKGKNQVYEASSSTHKLLFRIQGNTPAGKKHLSEILFNRVKETEETSLKFSNLPPEEISLWKEGRPSHQLQYELSFWSDLAKWFMGLQEEGQSYRIRFTAEPHSLPTWIDVEFGEVSFGCYIAEANWPYLVLPLASVDSPLVVHQFQNYHIKEILYHPDQKSLEIRRLEEKPGKLAQSPAALEKALEVGEWRFVPDVGFFPKNIDPIFQEKQISEKQMGKVLQRHPHIVQKYLVNAKLHPLGVKAQYHIEFDRKSSLHIHCYLFEKGDLQHPLSAFFGPWVYVHEKGFYNVENLLFDGVEKVVPREKMSDFINRHRVWLGGFEGFQTHVYAIESRLTFAVSTEGQLRFDASIEIGDTGHEMSDFGEWIYLREKGFFAKRVGRGAGLISPGTVLHRAEIPAFIRSHREDLESLRGFFASQCPIEKSGLEISLTENRRILVTPRFRYVHPYEGSKVQFFGDYTYVAGEGFCEVPPDKRVPDAYVREKTISLGEEAAFVLFELDTLEPYILSIQKELKKPRNIALMMEKLVKSERGKTAKWLLEGVFQTEIGSVSLQEIWQAVQENKRYLISPAGLILLKHPRFHWLKGISGKRWLKNGKQLSLTTIEWLRLNVFEEVRAPKGNTSEERKTRTLLEELKEFQTEQPIDMSGFKSDLRAYQEVGVKWLWFLYLHGLSGLLCDEMGLGKTHQAMGLIAAMQNERKEGSKILVVCPTSVIYHWEELLAKFLPTVRPLIFYGITRSMEDFETNYDLLLTSYGTLRSEKEALSKIDFEVAVFDELQIAKNPHSQTHKSLRKIKAQMRIGLTGTPIENRLLELKALFDVVIPGYLPQEAQFKEFFSNPIEKGQDPEKKMLLSKLIKPFILRRKKTEVLLELPEKIEEIAYCELSDEQQELYKKTFLEHKNALLDDLENRAKPVPYLHVFSLLSTLKQICDHPCLISKQTGEWAKHKSGKWNHFVELLEEVRDSGQKLVVFSQYLDMLDIMELYLKQNKIGYCSIRGSTRNRKEQLQKFRDDPKSEVFLASLQAVGVGVDLVSASVVIHYDRWWNPARENQATDRVHRIGQNRGVQVFKLVTKGTVEEHIHRLIEKKQALAEGVLGYDDQDQIKGLSREELLQLLTLIDKDVANH